jgi:hypothetical protein
MQRAKEHKRVLKSIINEEKLTPSRAILAEFIVMVFDSKDASTRRRHEIGALAHIGGPRLVEVFLSQIEKEPDRSVKPLLRNFSLIQKHSHQRVHNRLQRDTRSHPNARLTLAISVMVQDANTLHERIFFDTVYLGTCMDIRGHIRLVGPEEEGIREPHYTNSDKAVGAEITDFNKFFTSVKGGSDVKSTE